MPPADHAGWLDLAKQHVSGRAPISGTHRLTVTRRSAADVYDEIQSAKAAQEAADAEARRVLREQRRAEYKDKWEQFKNTLKSAVT